MTLLLAWATAGSRKAQDLLLNTEFLFWCTVVSGAGLPLLVWLGRLLRGRRREK